MLPNLENMPEPIMEKIFGYAGFKAVLTLRHVSRSLRNFIDSSDPSILSEINLYSIEINVTAELIDLRFQFWDSDDSHILNIYKNENLNDEDVLNSAILNLALILRFQKSKILENFTLNFVPTPHGLDSIAHKFPEFLRSKNFKSFRIRAKNFKFGIFKESEFLSISKFLDPDVVKSLDFARSNYYNKMDLKMEQIFETGHWKKAEELNFRTQYFLGSFENLKDFLRIEISIEILKTDELDFLKKTLPSSSKFQKFQIFYKKLENPKMLQHQWVFTFSPGNEKYWYFRCQDSDYCMEICYNPNHRKVDFTKMFAYEVPDVDLVQDVV